MGSHRRLNAGDPRRRAELAAWAAGTVTHAEASHVVAAAAVSLAVSSGLAVDDAAAPELIRDGRDGVVGLDVPPGLVADPWDLGIVLEATHDAASRRRGGIHYTPRPVASGLAAIALADADSDITVCDPSVGGGAFLLAAAETLRRQGSHPCDVLRRLSGIDIDPLAVAVTQASLGLWAAADGCWPDTSPHLIVADALDADADADTSAGGPRDLQADVIIGNPPFRNQLARGTAHGRDALGRLRRRWKVDAGPYCDTAGWFLLAALELVAPGGRIVLVLPQSLLASADASPIRDHLEQRSTLTGLWIGDRGVFDAQVRVCAPMLQVHAGPPPDTAMESGTGIGPDTQPKRLEFVAVWSGPEVVAAPAVAAPTSPGRWGELLARTAGVPVVEVGAAAPLGSWCSATAGFRAQFYGLAAHTVDLARADGRRRTDADDDRSAEPAPLVTVGMIEPLACGWGSGALYRYAGAGWVEPAVDVVALDAADPGLARWVRDRLHPKVLVATQTRVVEAAVDVDGRWVPSTPTIAVTAPVGRLWHLAAALMSPVASAAALAATAGTALSGDTIKVSARQVLELPTPVDDDAWDEGARLAQAIASGATERAGGFAELGRVMIAASGRTSAGEADALFDWWWARLMRP